MKKIVFIFFGLLKTYLYTVNKSFVNLLYNILMGNIVGYGI